MVFIREILLLGIECLSVLLPTGLVFLVLCGFYKRRGAEPGRKHFFALLVFAVYISAVFAVTSSGTVFDAMRHGIYRYYWDPTIWKQLSLIPFSQENYIYQYVLNVLMLVPFGFLLPAIWKKSNSVLCIAAAGFSFSLLIELSQLLNHRKSDVDDLITNTAGAVLGLLCFRLFAKLTKWDTGHAQYVRAEPIIYVAAMFLGHFLLFDQPTIVGLLYK